MKFTNQKKDIIRWARLLNEKGFVSGRSGNISYRVSDQEILITAHDSYLGYLEDNEVVSVNFKENSSRDKANLSSERLMHFSIHQKIADAKVVVHAHPSYATAFFHYFDKLEIFSFEGKFYLSNVAVIAQETPTVTDLDPVIKALENNNIVVLKNHGVISIGSDFKQAVSLIEMLEEQAKVNLLIRGKSQADNHNSQVNSKSQIPCETSGNGELKYELLSEKHIQKLVSLINHDQTARELGRKYDLTCTLAVKNQDADRAVCFYYDKGEIVKTDNSEAAEFVIIGKENVLKKVFNKEIDPFVASTQGKVKTKGDFAKMSRWYPVLVRTFQLWEQAPVY